MEGRYMEVLNLTGDAEQEIQGRNRHFCLLHCSLYELHWAATRNRYCFVNTAYNCCQSEIFSEFLVCKTLVESEIKFQRTTVPVKCKSWVCGCSSWSFVVTRSLHILLWSRISGHQLCVLLSVWSVHLSVSVKFKCYPFTQKWELRLLFHTRRKPCSLQIFQCRSGLTTLSEVCIKLAYKCFLWKAWGVTGCLGWLPGEGGSLATSDWCPPPEGRGLGASLPPSLHPSTSFQGVSCHQLSFFSPGKLLLRSYSKVPAYCLLLLRV